MVRCFGLIFPTDEPIKQRERTKSSRLGSEVYIPSQAVMDDYEEGFWHELEEI